MKKFNNRAIDLMTNSLKNGCILFSDATWLFNQKYRHHFPCNYDKCTVIPFDDLTVSEKLSYFSNLLYYDESGEVCVYDCEPAQVELSKEVKIAFIKCVARNGLMTSPDLELCSMKLVLSHSDWLCSEEVHPIEHIRLTDLL